MFIFMFMFMLQFGRRVGRKKTKGAQMGVIVMGIVNSDGDGNGNGNGRDRRIAVSSLFLLW